jgi:LAO/AO transport system kinase
VLITTASTGDGVPALLAALDRHRDTGRTDASGAARHARAAAQVRSLLAERLDEQLEAGPLAVLSEDVVADVAAHRTDPYTAADRLLDAIRAAGR